MGSETVAGPADVSTPTRRILGASAGRQRQLDWFERLVLVAFALVSAWVLFLDLWQVIVDGRVWTGTDGLFLTDQMQYLAWIRSASQHVLVSDLFVLHPTPGDYLQPLIVVSGGLTALGVAAWLSLMLWQPLAVIAMFLAARAFVRLSLAGRGVRRAALVIALFGGSLPAIGDAWPGFWSWGYPYALLAIAAMVGSLISYDRARAAGALSSSAPVLGALAAWLHPWQGETLVLIVIGSELVMFTGERRAVVRTRIILAAVTVSATGLPLLYYVVLAHADPQWGIAQAQSKHTYPPATVLLALAPFLAASALAYRTWPHRFLATATRLWPLAAAGVFVVSETGISATPLHALAGITLPLAVLSVEGLLAVGWRRLPGRRALGPALVLLATLPSTIAELIAARGYVEPTPANATFIDRHERRALDYLAADPTPGGVLTRAYLGLITPAETGRHTYLGACQWSEPNCQARETLVHLVFQTPGVSPQTLRSAVLSTGARFVLASDCSLPGKNLDHILAPLTRTVHHFGCATLFDLR